MLKTKKSLLYLSCLLLIGLMIFIITSILPNEEKKNYQTISEDEASEIYQDMEPIEEQVSKALKEKGYEYIMLYTVYSKEKIDIKFALSNKEATIPEQKEVRSIFYEALIKSNFNPKSFNVKVANNDSPDW